eukprot:365907-Chlamydomonas_euryale.AAC.8
MGGVPRQALTTYVPNAGKCGMLLELRRLVLQKREGTRLAEEGGDSSSRGGRGHSSSRAGRDEAR